MGEKITFHDVAVDKDRLPDFAGLPTVRRYP